MKKWIPTAAALAVSLLLCAGFGLALTVYLQPMEDKVYDLSLVWQGEAMPEGWLYDQKGWNVFTQEGETVTELEPDGLGGFSGLGYPGQTFYFSRVMEENLDSPTLRLGAADRTFSVFLDGSLIYTDCPELDNRIGYLQLPCLDWYREENVLLSLPLDYAGKTLTIAQSANLDTPQKAYPCTVALYCGYTYESALIAESFQTALFSTLSFAAGAVLLALFLWRGARGRFDPPLICGALAAFLYEIFRLSNANFFYAYFGVPLVDVSSLCRQLALLNLLCLLLCKFTGWWRALLCVMLGGMGIAMPINLILGAVGQRNAFLETVFFVLGLIGFLVALAGSFGPWKRKSLFFRVFCPIAGVGSALLVLREAWSGRFWQQMSVGAFGYFLWLLMPAFMASALLGAAVELVYDEFAARTEARLLAQRGELALDSYQALRQHNDQVMMLRHDMAKHFQLLRQMTGEEDVAEYLDGLIGQNEEIRPVIQSGNEMLDIILNSRLSAAVDRKISIEITRSQAPERLPLSDMELCSLVMNLMDNAVEAASAPGIEHPYIKLDLCRKDHFFVLSCENATTPDWIKRKTAPEHGLGLKIVDQIVAKHENLLETETGRDFYRITLAVPLE